MHFAIPRGEKEATQEKQIQNEFGTEIPQNMLSNWDSHYLHFLFYMLHLVFEN